MSAKTMRKTLIAAASEGNVPQTRSPGMVVGATDAERLNEALGKTAGIGDAMADSLTSIRTKRKTSGKGKVANLVPLIDEEKKKKAAAEIARGQKIAGEIIQHAEKESAGWKDTLETILNMTPVERSAMRMSVNGEQTSVKNDKGEKTKLSEATFTNKERLLVLRLQNRSAYQRVSELMTFSKACDDGLNSKTMIEKEWRRVFGVAASWGSMSMHQIIAVGREYRRRLAEERGETPKQKNKGQSPEKKLKLLILRAVANGTIKVGDMKKHLPDVTKWATEVIGNVKHAGKLLVQEQKGITGAKKTA